MARALLILAIAIISLPVYAEEPDSRAKDEAAIRATVESYTTAFNTGDAEALAAHWSENGEWVSPDGDRVKGRAAILESMQSYFSEGGTASLMVSDTKIRFIASTVAVEEGKARVSRSGEAPSDTSYIAIHVKEEGKWKLESVRETAIPAAASTYEHLRELEWMVGTWVDEDGESTIETTCQWTKNKNFMTRSFRVMIKDRISMEGTQVVGYDASAGKIRSWVFDTEGGIGEGVWTQDGKRWIINTSHIAANGDRGSSINIVTYVDENSFRWQSTGRELGGEIQPDIQPVTIVRK